MKPAKPVAQTQRAPTTPRAITRYSHGKTEAVPDQLATEEPLEIRLQWPGDATSRRLSVTMRTPGADEELAAGFLFAEGILRSPSDIRSIEHCPLPGERQEFNTLLVELAKDVKVDWARLERPFVVSSACGVCGRASLDGLHASHVAPIASKMKVDARMLSVLPALLRKHQETFESTGGIHAAALFDAKGRLESVREDVGRHNALDKLVGAAFLKGAVPLPEKIVLVSGRASFELLQKSARAGIPMFAAVGAPSSLAVEVAEEFGITLVGFLKPDRFNVYSHPQRISD